MCRLVLYKGPAISLGHLLHTPKHSIIKQSYEAREMLRGTTNEDGFGLAWYAPHWSDEPAVYRSIQPISNDVNMHTMAGKISSDIILAHVRGASEGMPVAITNTHPFSWQRYAFMHNGAVDEFRSRFFPELFNDIHPSLWPHIKGNTDSEHVFGLWLSYLGLDKNASLHEQVSALRRTFQRLESIAQTQNLDIVLNIGISDGQNIIAARFHYGSRKATLYYNDHLTLFPDAVMIASEAQTDDAGWKPVPERSILTITSNNILHIEAF